MTAALGVLTLDLLAACASGPANSSSSGSDAASINVQLGVDYLKQGNLELAQSKLLRALQEDSHSADVHSALALLDERLGKARDADKEYQRALRLSHDAPGVLNNYAVYLCSHGRPDEGVKYFEEAASNPLYRTPWAAYTNAGVCLQGVHRDQEAMQRFTRALQINPNFADATLLASGLEFSEQHYVQARLRIDVFLMNNPATPDLLLLAWRIAGAQNDVAGQKRYATQLAKDFPHSGQERAVELAARGSTSG
jgi:type IV pilus assembly protein PilF